MLPDVKVAFPDNGELLANRIVTITRNTPLELSVMFALKVRLAEPDVTSTLVGVKPNEVTTGFCVS